MAEYNPSKIIKDGNTYNFRDTTKIPLAGSNQISGDLIPSTDNSIDIGSSAKNIKMLYTKGITIDAKTIDTDTNGNMTYDGHIVDTIEEQGSNYIRYSRGLQICWGVYSRTTETNSDINFPKAFIYDATHPLGISVSGQSQTLFAAGWSSTVIVINNTNSGGFTYIAVGTWK